MNKRTAFRHKKGFTLIELVVVIAIMGILASIVTVSATSIAKSSEKKAATSSVLSCWETTNTYFLQLNAGFGGSPSLTQLKTRISNVTGLSTNAPTSLAKGKYYVQYTYNKSDLRSKYTIVKITYNYKGKYYSSTNGSTVTGPKTSL